MERQLDARAGAMLQAAVEAKGIDVYLNAETARIAGDKRAERVELKDGRIIPADHGDRRGRHPPERRTRAGRAGSTIGRGIVVDDGMQTSHRRRLRASANAPSIAASATGWSSRPTSRRACWRPVSPAATRSYRGQRARDQSEGLRRQRVLGRRFHRRGRHRADRALAIRASASTRSWSSANGRLVGAVLFGDTADGLWYLELIRSGAPITRMRVRPRLWPRVRRTAKAA